jgi:hypothetical protein
MVTTERQFTGLERGDGRLYCTVVKMRLCQFVVGRE